MSGFSDPIIGGVQKLIRKAIQSPNYVAGSAGWTINKDGSNEFNNGTFRGTVTASTFQGTDFVINSTAELFYSGTPAAGNLIVSIAPAAGTDSFGNTYPQGIGVQGTGGQMIVYAAGSSNHAFTQLLSSLNKAQVVLQPDSTSFATAGTLIVDTTSPGLPSIFVKSPIISGQTGASLTLTGGSGLSGPPTGTIDATGGFTFTGPVFKDQQTWQTPTPGSGWSLGPVGGTVQQIEYRRDAEDNLVIIGAIHTTSATPASTMFTLPSGYRPAINQRVVTMTNVGGTLTANYIEIPPSGNVFMGKAITSTNTDIYFSVIVPLGNLS